MQKPVSPFSFFFEKGNPVTTKSKIKKSVEKPRRLPPIVVVPDKSYIDDTGNVIPTDVILISDLSMYSNMKAILELGERNLPGVPRERGTIEG